MTRLKRLPENQLKDVVNSTEAELVQYKSQQFAGNDSVRTQRIFSGAAYDLQINNIHYHDRKFRLTFTPAGDPDKGGVLKMEYRMSQDTTNGLISTFVEREKVASNGQQSWLFVLQGSDTYPTAWARFAFFFWAGGAGSFATTIL